MITSHSAKLKVLVRCEDDYLVPPVREAVTSFRLLLSGNLNKSTQIYFFWDRVVFLNHRV